MACTQGSRSGEPARFQALRFASIALNAVCRWAPSGAGGQRGLCAGPTGGFGAARSGQRMSVQGRIRVYPIVSFEDARSDRQVSGGPIGTSVRRCRPIAARRDRQLCGGPPRQSAWPSRRRPSTRPETCTMAWTTVRIVSAAAHWMAAVKSTRSSQLGCVPRLRRS